MQKAVSIIVPVYNAEDTLVRCVESILSNGYSDYEIILIDDGSSDGSLKILTAYGEKYPDTIRIFHQENQGVAVTRNTGIGYAEGKYVMFIYCDDFVDPDYIAIFVGEIERGGLDIVIGGYRRTTDSKTLFEMRLAPVEWSKYMVMAPWAKIYRLEFLATNGILFLDNDIGEDVYFNLQAIHVTEKIVIIDYRGYNWIYNEKSVSNTSQKTIGSELHVIRLLDACHAKLTEKGFEHQDLVEYYFTRYIVWYLLFIGKNSDHERMHAEYARLFGWLDEKFPEYRRNANISLFRPEGETFANRVAVYVFLTISRLNLARFFFWVYSIKLK